MKIAFYAPLKPPDHAVPSGDRLMARQLIAALEKAGHEVSVASTLRAYTPDPTPHSISDLRSASLKELERLARDWAKDAPDLWFCYHPYYKAPDLIGPGLAHRFGKAYVTAESSLSGKVIGTRWEELQNHVRNGVAQAAVNICMTERDRPGLLAAVPSARIAMLPPFVNPAPYAPAHVEKPDMITVAMMRPGDKLRSYAMLAAALALLPEGLPWRLRILGNGPAERQVRALFAPLDPSRLDWLGECSHIEVAAELGRSSLYVWPGYGEAYGLAYLEAQASGLAVVAQSIAGVPEVVLDGITGVLTPVNDAAAFAAAIGMLLKDPTKRRQMGLAAQNYVLKNRSLDAASAQLDLIVRSAVAL